MFEIHLLGTPDFLLDGKPFKFAARPKTLPLLAYLLLHRDRPTSRDVLAFALWPDETESTAHANFRRHLHQLARGLPGASSDLPWLLSDSAGVQWNTRADYWLDVAEFEKLSASEESMEEAVALYAGDLAENTYDDCLIADRERLRDLFFADLSRLVAIKRAQRDFPAAIAYAQQLLSRDAFREDAARQLMSLRYEAGDRAGALHEFARFARRLRDEMGVEPMPETVAMYEVIARNGRLATAVPIIETRKGETETRLTLPFVGRETQMEQLRTHWSRAARGRGGLVLIGGEAGIGKTRLANELSLIAEREGARVLYGGAAFGEPIPYQVLVEALRPAARLMAAMEIDPTWLSAMAPLCSDLRSLRPELPVLPALDAERERARLFEAFARCLEGLARPRPLLLILDDLHWASRATISLLEHIVRRAPQHALLILATYRVEEASGAHPLRELRRLQPEQTLAHLTLMRLSERAVETLVKQLSGFEPASDRNALAQRLYAESEGNPFFLAELIRDRLESGGDTERETPTSVQQLILSRVSRLSPSTRALADAAAIVGVAFDVELVSQVGGWSEAEVLDALNELLDRQLIREGAGRTRSDYLFNHHLIQAAIYTAVPEAARKRRHRRVAHVLEGVNPQRLDELAGDLAFHFERAEAWREAIRYYRAAGDHAAKVFAYASALDLYDHSFGLLDRLSVAPHEMEAERLELLIHRQRILGLLIHVRQWEKDVDEIERIANARGEVAARLLALEARLSIHVFHGDMAALEATAEQARALARKVGDEAAEARIAHVLGRHLLMQLSLPVRAGPHLQRALELAESRSDSALLFSVLCDLAQTERQLGNLTHARELALRALNLSETNAELAPARGEALFEMGCIAWDRAEWESAGTTMETAARHLSAAQNILALGEATLVLATITAQLGQPDLVKRIYETILVDERKRTDLPMQADLMMWTKSGAMGDLASLGDLETAEQLCTELREWMERTYAAPQIQAFFSLGRLRFAQHRYREAAEALARAVQVWDGRWAELQPLLLHALAAQRAGDRAAAQASLSRAEAMAGKIETARFNVLLHYARFEVLGDLTALHQARTELRRQAALIRDENLRADFLERVPLHREIETRWQSAVEKQDL